MLLGRRDDPDWEACCSVVAASAAVVIVVGTRGDAADAAHGGRMCHC